MTSLKIAKNLSLPLETVTQTLALLAKRRAGKSYTMRRIVEQLFKAGQQVVLVDPKGDQWGVRSTADGKGPGLPIVILGGERGDAPLEPSGGEVVAKLVVEERVSVLLDISLFRKHEVATFMTAFLENLYRLKAREIYRTPMMLVIDEADAIAPQKPMKGEERMLGAAEDIVRRGGQRGIGCILVTQRSAVLNKNVLTQTQMLVALRTIAPQDLAAMDAWIQVHGEPEQRKTLMESLPSLPVGDAWFWSPGWPTTEGIFRRVHVLPIETFDSGATPKPGVKPIEPKKPADIDLNALKRQMTATIERAKAEDPRVLRARIQELERKAKAAPVPLPKVAAAKVEIKEVPVVTDKQFAQLDKAAARVADVLKRVIESSGMIKQAVDSLQAISSEISTTARMKSIIKNELSLVRQGFQVLPAAQATSPLPISFKTPKTSHQGSSERLPGGERKLLTALAQYPEGRSKVQVAILTGYAHSGGAFGNYLGALRSKGYVAGSQDHLRITEEGVAALGAFDPLPAGAALLEHWRRQLGKAERAALDVLVAAYPHALTKEVVAEQAGYEAGGGGFGNALSRLRTLELIHGRSELRASDTLFG